MIGFFIPFGEPCFLVPAPLSRYVRPQREPENIYSQACPENRTPRSDITVNNVQSGLPKSSSGIEILPTAKWRATEGRQPHSTHAYGHVE